MNPLTCVSARPLLSAYIDGDLDPAGIEAIHTHLQGCADCAGVVADLRKVSESARDLGPVSPPARSWQAVARRTRTELDLAGDPRPVRRSLPAIWQWVGLSAAILAVTTTAYLLGPARPADGDNTVSPTAPPALQVNAPAGESPGLTDELNAAVDHYERAIAVLQSAAGSGTGSIEPEAAAALAADGTALDQAIAESRAALATSPDSEPARVSLFEALRRKIAMLQATVALINEMNQGDPAGAARAAEGLGRKS